MSRPGQDDRLLKQMQKFFPRDKKVKLQSFDLNHLPGSGKFPSNEVLTDHAYFWLSDNVRFWFYREGKESYSLPAVVLTDTGK